MRRRVTTTVLLVTGLASAGCLRTDTTHTLYLSPEGAVHWTIDQSNVHSDEADEGKRLDEEQGFVGAALIGEHPMARALRALTPDGPVHTVIVRDERPFHLITEASFSRIDRTMEQLLHESGLRGSAVLTRNGAVRRLHVQFDFSSPLHEGESPASVLLEDFAQLTFVLTRGRFVAGGGIEVEDSGRAVVSREWAASTELAVEARGTIELVLTWTLDEGRRAEAVIPSGR